MISTVSRRMRFFAGIRPTRLTLFVLAIFTMLAVVAAVPVGAASGGRSSDTVTFYGTDVVSVDTVSGFKASPQQFGDTLSAIYSRVGMGFLQ